MPTPKAKKTTSRDRDYLRQIEELQIRLTEAEETLRAIREGEVDAVIVKGTRGEQVFSLLGTDSIYRLIVETMKEAAFTLDFEGRILFSNAQFGDLIRRPLEQIIGHPVVDFVAAGSRATAAALPAAVQSNPFRKRLVFEASDGSDIPAHIAASLLNQPDGESICVVASDLTELENSTELIQQLRRQQEALQASNAELAATEDELRIQNEKLSASRAELERTRARYQDFFESAPDGYIVTDPEGSIQEVNEAAAHLLDCGPADLRGNPFSSLLPMAERDSYQQVLASLDAGPVGKPKWEAEMRTLKGARFWASISASSSLDEKGTITSLRWLIRDFSERKRAEDSLKASEGKFRSLFEHSLDAIFLAHPDGRVTDANPAACRMFGKTKEEICRVGREAIQSVERKDVTAALEERAKVGAVSREMIYLRADGTRVHTDMSSVIIPDEDGPRSFVILHDITNRKMMEESLRQLTAELARSNKDLEDFAHVASHDLQEPLRMVSSFLTLLQEKYKGQLDDTAHEYIGFSIDGSNRMASLVRDLLDYARVNSANKELVPVDLAVIKEEVTANLRASIEESGAVITHDPLPTVVADAGQMKQLLQNLIGNAIKFRVKGRVPEIHIGARLEADTWTFHVKDNGIGIDRDQYDRIFQVFQRLHGREEFSGTGIGLAICKKIVERHGGRIWVESEPGQGSTFLFSIPAR